MVNSEMMKAIKVLLSQPGVYKRGRPRLHYRLLTLCPAPSDRPRVITHVLSTCCESAPRQCSLRVAHAHAHLC